MGNMGRFRGVKCVALPQLNQPVEAGDSDDTGDTQACDFSGSHKNT